MFRNINNYLGFCVTNRKIIMNKKIVVYQIRSLLENNKTFNEYSNKYSTANMIVNIYEGNASMFIQIYNQNKNFIDSITDMNLLIGFLRKKYEEYGWQGEMV